MSHRRTVTDLTDVCTVAEAWGRTRGKYVCQICHVLVWRDSLLVALNEVPRPHIHAIGSTPARTLPSGLGSS
ncbi:MAG: hypothetical protein WCK70_19680 [Chloroflexales bacterium]